ncbi:uncharacterized protein BO72DRAFT_120136 [Aspergillus fijiensis CBS 313.89]|uniref:Uncharacterized protein n=1 Tax=Aspergillus fijiensis CBS 313.89 TaxID=1448319 RepID=A0A8G1RPZ5_9EURO|nr:uncharacterized protein BO72DRAFT_120136 [Aspergillus fijiensis CBS 313.89]RAK76754.1 hypothetical protein BO72DRAFT_120136 [Aspergillus fijiensis CBS 313.89]
MLSAIVPLISQGPFSKQTREPTHRGSPSLCTVLAARISTQPNNPDTHFSTMKAAAASKAGTIHTSTYVKNSARNHPCWVHSVLVMTYGERIMHSCTGGTSPFTCSFFLNGQIEKITFVITEMSEIAKPTYFHHKIHTFFLSTRAARAVRAATATRAATTARTTSLAWCTVLCTEAEYITKKNESGRCVNTSRKKILEVVILKLFLAHHKT